MKRAPTFFWRCLDCGADGVFRSHAADSAALISEARRDHDRAKTRCVCRSIAVVSNTPEARHARCVERREPAKRVFAQ